LLIPLIADIPGSGLHILEHILEHICNRPQTVWKGE